jgi:hypothetical protein
MVVRLIRVTIGLLAFTRVTRVIRVVRVRKSNKGHCVIRVIRAY